MNDLEDLLTRTLQDPVRALPAPADPLPGIRRRVRRQRRTGVAGALAVAVVAAGVIAVPAVVLRPSAPEPGRSAAAAPSGLLDWPARGPRTGDRALIDGIVRQWRSSGDPPVTEPEVLWAGADGAVILQARTAGGPTVAAMTVSGRSVFRLEPLPSPAVTALRVYGARPVAELLMRPGAVRATFTNAGQAPQTVAVGADGRITLSGTTYGGHLVALGAGGHVLGEATVGVAVVLQPSPPPKPVLRVPDDVRIVDPQVLWAGSDAAQKDYDRLPVLAGQLAGSGPLSATVIPAGSFPDTGGPVRDVTFYELHRDGRTWVGGVMWQGNSAECVQLQDITGRREKVPSVALHCPVPGTPGGVLAFASSPELFMTRARVEPAGPGQRAFDARNPLPSQLIPATGGEFPGAGAEFPGGPGELSLTDPHGRALPPVPVPAYPAK